MAYFFHLGTLFHSKFFEPENWPVNFRLEFFAKLSPSPSLSLAELVIFSINPATHPPTHPPPPTTHPDKSRFYV